MGSGESRRPGPVPEGAVPRSTRSCVAAPPLQERVRLSRTSHEAGGPGRLELKDNIRKPILFILPILFSFPERSLSVTSAVAD